MKIAAATIAAALFAFAGCTTAPDAATAIRLERAERVQRLVIDCLNAHADRLHRVESDTRYLRANAELRRY